MVREKYDELEVAKYKLKSGQELSCVLLVFRFFFLYSFLSCIVAHPLEENSRKDQECLAGNRRTKSQMKIRRGKLEKAEGIGT